MYVNVSYIIKIRMIIDKIIDKLYLQGNIKILSKVIGFTIGFKNDVPYISLRKFNGNKYRNRWKVKIKNLFFCNLK